MSDLQRETDCKETQENFLDSWEFLYLDEGSGSMAVCVPHSTKNCLNVIYM